ncbi:hypothetical protein ACGIF2_09915 [Cellulomonas sp. P22]|uniref:hypothetical protein n=1 Tax=Cellulomonas sp. P22 TaxID=3373189 RepID=UPI00379EEE11
MVVAAGYVGVTQPQNRWAVAIGLVVLAVAILLVVSDRRWLDTAPGAVGRSRLGRHRRVPLQPTSSVQLISNRGGGVLLVTRPQKGRPINIAVLLLSDYVERSLPADFLRLLADTIERGRPGGARSVVAELRAQADHVAGGGSARTSPLAARATYGAINAAKLGGAGGVAGHL